MPVGLPNLGQGMMEMSPELKRLEEALMHATDTAKKVSGVVGGAGGKGEKEGEGKGTGAPPSLEASNAALPPTPKPEQDAGIGRILPNAFGGEKIKTNLEANGPMTPPVHSPTLGKGEKPDVPVPANASAAAVKGLPVLHEASESPAGNFKKDDGGGPMDVDKKPGDEDKKDDHGLANIPLPNLNPKPFAPFPTLPGGDDREDIGLHCWIIGMLQEEVDQAVEMLQALFDEKIEEFNKWAEENEFDPASLDEESDSESEDEEDKKKPVGAGKEDVEMKPVNEEEQKEVAPAVAA